MNNLQIMSMIIGMVLIGLTCINIPRILKDKKVDIDEWKEIGDMAVEIIKVGLTMSKITTKQELKEYAVQKLNKELNNNKNIQTKINENELRMIVSFLVHGMEKSVL